MKKVLTYLGLILAACLVLVACASNKPAEKKKATPTPTERAKADATVLIDTMLGKSSNGFSKLYGENYETWTETNVFEKQVAAFLFLVLFVILFIVLTIKKTQNAIITKLNSACRKWP